ncbi:MAG TPA: ABC transporter substrate-binding protein [Candidatus Dormibacteraeota bacterium]|nr:ABC transporter substrate-binding protein [Candidatus Dormibacteraeota bacterium]
MRRSRLPVVLLSGLLAAAACGGDGPPVDLRGTVQVALVSVFSGADPSRGRYLQNSLQAEIDELNAGGGLLGRELTLVSADDEMQPAKAAELVREHLADGAVKLLVGPSSPATFAGSQRVIAASGVPNCLPTPIPDRVLSGAVTTFRTREGSASLASALMAYVQKHTQLRSVGLIAPADGQDALFSSLAPKFGLDYAGVAPPGPDVQGAVQELVGKGAQALVLPADMDTAALAVQAIQALGLSPNRVRAFGPGDLATSAFAQAVGPAAVGTVLVAPDRDYLGDRSPGAWPTGYRAFVNRIVARYGYTADGIGIKGLPEAADCLTLWARAVQQAGTFDGPRVVRAWESLRVGADETALGVPETFSASNHDAIGSGDLFVYQWVRRGQQLRLQELSGP